MKIRTMDDFLCFIKADLKSRGQQISFVCFIKDPITRFHWYLRLYELLDNFKFLLPIGIVMKFIFLSKSQQLGFSIPKYTLAKGVYIPHFGTIVVNSKAFVGEYSVLNVGVVIGRHPKSKSRVPEIGRHVYIAPGVKIFGKVNIGDSSVLGANAVVTKSIPAQSLAGGVPAKVIRLLSEREVNEYAIGTGVEE